MKKTTWNTYAVSNNASGVYLHQVRRTKAGWQKRIAQIDGCHVAYGSSVAIKDTNGEAAFQLAQVIDIIAS